MTPWLQNNIRWILVLVAIALVILAVALFAGGKPAPTTTSGQVTLPAAGSAPASSGSVPGTGSIGSPVSNGAPSMRVNGLSGPINVLDFIHNGETGADPQNPGTYYLAGSLGYCLSDGTCPHGASTTDFYISYNSNSQSFIVTLFAEPLGKVRMEAEQFLEQRLGINSSQMCMLNYYLGTVSAVNDFFAGKNLGFSFCPGAVQLPQ